MSEVAETALAACVLATKPERTLNEAYQELFDFILPLLKKFGCTVEIAEGTETASFNSNRKNNEYEVPYKIFLTSDGSFYIDELDRYLDSVNEISPQDFLRPLEILSNLVDVLAKNEETRTEKMNEIVMARNIVEAICKTLVKRPK